MPTSQRPVVIVGSRVTYHGSIAELHGQSFIALPCQFNHPDRCTACVADDLVRYSLHAPGTTVRHVHPSSLTPDPGWTPASALMLTVGRLRYWGCHTTWSGSTYARILHFHTADGAGGHTFLRMQTPTETVRRLDVASIRCLATPSTASPTKGRHW